VGGGGAAGAAGGMRVCVRQTSAYAQYRRGASSPHLEFGRALALFLQVGAQLVALVLELDKPLR
jgi:alkylation response protein AidB-like acyl-CoA dehydrogenase